jgi:AraC-like DNA-binding protein
MDARLDAAGRWNPLSFPEWLRPLRARVPPDQILVPVDRYGAPDALARLQELVASARVRLLPAAGGAAALLLARVAGLDDIVTPELLTAGWDADLRPKSLLDAMVPVACLGWQERRAVRLLRAEATSPTVEDLAQAAGLRPHTLLRRLRERAGVSSNDLLLAAKVDRATYLLVGGLPITDVALAVGFSECAAFSRMLKSFTGHSPREWRDIVRRDPSAPLRVRNRHQQPLGGVGRGSPSDVEPSGPDAAAQSSSPAR